MTIPYVLIVLRAGLYGNRTIGFGLVRHSEVHCTACCLWLWALDARGYVAQKLRQIERILVPEDIGRIVDLEMHLTRLSIRLKISYELHRLLECCPTL